MILVKAALTFQQHILIIDVMGEALKKLNVCQSSTRLIKSFIVGATVLPNLASCNQAIGFDSSKIMLVGIFARDNGIVEKAVATGRPADSFQIKALSLISLGVV